MVKPLNDHQKKKYSQYLSAGEEVVAVFGIGDKYFWYNVIPLFPLSVALIGMPFLLKLFHQRHNYTYILTTRRVIIKEGIFTTEITTAPYEHITHITVREKFLQKLSFGVGDITIHTAGPTPVEIHLKLIQDPMQIKNLIEELIIKERTLEMNPPQKLPLVKPL